jgi:hypothetical protein
MHQKKLKSISIIYCKIYYPLQIYFLTIQYIKHYTTSSYTYKLRKIIHWKSDYLK